jgi:hypothetical protein
MAALATPRAGAAIDCTPGRARLAPPTLPENVGRDRILIFEEGKDGRWSGKVFWDKGPNLTRVNQDILARHGSGYVAKHAEDFLLLGR